MAGVETVPRCRGCAVPVPRSATGRRLTTGLSSNSVLLAWKSVLYEKLDDLKLTVDEEETKSGFVCRNVSEPFKVSVTPSIS